MTLRVVIAGGRDFNNMELFNGAIQLAFEDCAINEIELVCGMARGADTVGRNWALQNNLRIHEFPADWDKYGKRAGFLRNEEMAKFAHVGILFWDGKSKGTGHMLDLMRKHNKPTYVFGYGPAAGEYYDPTTE
jgi:hypothetical protein